MRRTRAIGLLLAVAFVAAVAAIAHVGSAAALDPPWDILTPPGYDTPYDALRAGAYGTQQAQKIAALLEGYEVPTDGGSIADAFADLSASDDAYAVGRIVAAAGDAGAEATVAEVATAGGLTTLGFVTGVGAVAVGGYLVYKYVLHGSDGSDHTEYVRFNREDLGGARVVVPGSPWVEGTDWRPVTTNEPAPFGWVKVGPVWVFNYELQMAGGTVGSPCPGYSFCYPVWHDVGSSGQYSEGSGNLGRYAIADYDWCVEHYGVPNTVNVATSWGQYGDCGNVGYTSAQTMPAALSAANQTLAAMDGALTPLEAHYITLGAGEYVPGTSSLVGGNQVECHPTDLSVPCHFVYVNDTDMEALLPRTVTATDPGGSVDSGVTVTAPTDIQASTTRTTITDSLGDPCGQAILNHLIDPAGYPYYGCTQETTPNTTVAPNPDYIVPDCTGLTVSACQTALNAAAGTTITTTTNTLDAWNAVITQAAGAVVETNPAGGATVSNTTTVELDVNPATMPITFPAPQPDETFDDWIARLNAGGYTGTVTQVAEPAALDGYGPDSPTRIQYYDPRTGTIVTLDPLQWPDPETIPPDTAITVRVNPTTAVPVATTGGGADCLTCAIDWSPLENLGLGSKFPFGTATWLSGGLAALTPSGGCPTLVIPYPAALGHGEVDEQWCSSAWENDYRPWVFPVLKALMTIAAVAFFGFKILGLGSGGGDE